MSGTYEQCPRCPKCKLAGRKRVSPLIIEWDVGSDVIGDFTWPSGLGEVIVTDRVRACFASKGFTGIKFEPVEMVQKPGLKRPRKESGANRRVWLPYSGPPIWNLLVTSSRNLDLLPSGRSLVTDCPYCKRERMIVHDKSAPFVLTPHSGPDTDFFRIQEMGKLTYVTEDVKQVIEDNKYTNVILRERGSMNS